MSCIPGLYVSIDRRNGDGRLNCFPIAFFSLPNGMDPAMNALPVRVAEFLVAYFRTGLCEPEPEIIFPFLIAINVNLKADFFILNNECSRSLSFCTNKIVSHLNGLTCSPTKVTNIYEELKSVHDSIQTETINSIVHYGLHEYISNFISNISNLDQNIQGHFFN